MVLGLSLWSIRPGYTQDYRYEIGADLGASYYRGDASTGRLLPPLGLAFGGLIRYNANLRTALVGQLTYRGLRGQTGSESHYPDGQTASFDTRSVSLSIGGEYHWYPLSHAYRYLGTRSLSPYIGGGLGAVVAWGDKDGLVAPLVYATFGVKYRVSERVTLYGAWGWSYTLTDRLDALSAESAFLADPYKLKSSRLAGNDSMGQLTLGVAYQFGRRKSGYCP